MDQIISHAVSENEFEAEYLKIQNSAIALGSTEYATIEQRLDLLQQLRSFEFGRFLILNRGMNGYWTDYVCTSKESDRPLKSDLEGFLLFDRPMALATRERYRIFQTIIQKEILSGIRICSVPSGLMSDVLTLNFEGVSNFELTAFDLDNQSLEYARESAKAIGISDNFKSLCIDAWNLSVHEYFDLVVSSGLNIYVKENKKVIELYKEFFKILKPGGILIVSFLAKNEDSIPERHQSNQRKQHVIYAEILEFKGSNLRTYAETVEQLKSAGFGCFELFADQFNVFPTIKARRPK
jgi:2-polyprenyl-3-methyl-5-hydroxy-6-metoxy-1,4-benzoquinol methylase